jgi:hypothetical protein
MSSSLRVEYLKVYDLLSQGFGPGFNGALVVVVNGDQQAVTRTPLPPTTNTRMTIPSRSDLVSLRPETKQPGGPCHYGQSALRRRPPRASRSTSSWSAFVA